MKKIILFILVFLTICSSCHAGVIKGNIDKVDIKAYEITVNGKKVKVSRASVFTENDRRITKSIIIRDLKDHQGEKVICYGFDGKDGIFDAYKVRVIEGRK